MGTVVSAWTRSFVEYAEGRGLVRDGLLAGTGIAGEELQLSDGRVPADTDTAIWKRALSELGDPTLGLDFAHSGVKRWSFGVVGQLARASNSVGDAAHALAAHFPLIKDDGAATLRRDRALWVLRLQQDPGQARWVPEIEDAMAASAVLCTREWSTESFAPIRVRLQRPRPRSTHAWDELFRCAIEFSQDATEFILSPDAMAIPLTSREEELSPYLAVAADTYLRQLRSRQSVGERVIAAIGAVGLELEAVARELGVSSRTLQRQLREAGTRYQELLDEFRRRRALALLDETSLTMGQVAARAGFADARSLRRALRRWQAA